MGDIKTAKASGMTGCLAEMVTHSSRACRSSSSRRDAERATASCIPSSSLLESAQHDNNIIYLFRVAHLVHLLSRGPSFITSAHTILERQIQDYMLTLFTFTFAKRRIRPPNAWQEVSNTNDYGSVSDSLDQHADASECMASIYIYI